jgi:CHAT domain-containing protein
MDLFDTDLVVLSACNTGLGDILSGEGVFGLQRAFKTAGVKNTIVSLWEVDDEATRILMEKFYKHYFDKKSAHESLKLAQKEMREGEFSEPYFWAGFILVE